MSTLLRKVTILLLVGCAAFAFIAEADEEELVKRANAWKPGEPVLSELLVFRESSDCVASPTETAPLLENITNYELLQEILLSPCDERVFAAVVARALLLVGPNRLFEDVRERYLARPELLSEPRHRKLKARFNLPHVVVDGLCIADSDMARDAADAVFAQITADLKAGMAFDAVQKKYWEAHEYSYLETLSDGTQVTLYRTRVGYYGDFVISEQSRDAYPFRFAEVPKEHVRPLLSRRAGDIVVLRDEAEHRSILYRVREVYSPR